ncbi:MAG: hypothetical protein QOH25_2004 [Acidobacteriota bacterium]|jgi:hypothetical protein|nr:hypothetical protein [Acidobacteriota bacterium]
MLRCYKKGKPITLNQEWQREVTGDAPQIADAIIDAPHAPIRERSEEK